MKKTMIDVADMRLSKDSDEVLVAPSLGSCVAISIHDETANAGGLMIFMMPSADEVEFPQSDSFTYMFADTGIPAFFKEAFEFGLSKSRIKVVTAGGGQILGQTGQCNIGRRNSESMSKIIESMGLDVRHQSVGGTHNRSLSLEIRSGLSTIDIVGSKPELV